MPEVPVKMSITDIFEKNSKKMSNFQYKNPILRVQLTNYSRFYFNSNAHVGVFEMRKRFFKGIKPQKIRCAAEKGV